MNGLPKRIVITLALLSLPFIFGLLLTYEVIKIDWISFMEIQPSYRSMEAPLALPAGSVPIQGAAFIPGAGDPLNPVPADEQSLQRGQTFYTVNCAICHGPLGKGDGTVAEVLKRKPADLTADHVVGLSDGNIFVVVSNGLKPVAGFKGGMPALRENLTVGERWDVVNYVRSLQGKCVGGPKP
jgi:mono/diheme cytochrome c family protein